MAQMPFYDELQSLKRQQNWENKELTEILLAGSFQHFFFFFHLMWTRWLLMILVWIGAKKSLVSSLFSLPSPIIQPRIFFSLVPCNNNLFFCLVFTEGRTVAECQSQVRCNHWLYLISPFFFFKRHFPAYSLRSLWPYLSLISLLSSSWNQLLRIETCEEEKENKAMGRGGRRWREDCLIVKNKNNKNVGKTERNETPPWVEKRVPSQVKRRNPKKKKKINASC